MKLFCWRSNDRWPFRRLDEEEPQSIGIEAACGEVEVRGII